MLKRRRAVEYRLVFSSCQNSKPDSIFFLQDWRRTYHDFKLRLARHLVGGNHWIAHFDLAAFYETISHRALQSVVSPSGGSNEAWEMIRKCLCVWTSEAKGTYRLSLEVKNVFQGLGLISVGSKPHFDQIGDILRASYKLRPWRGWKALLGSNYQHALQLLLTAENKFYSDRSGWLASQNSFNDAIFGAFQDVLSTEGLAGAMPRKGKTGKWISFGVMLEAAAPFAQQFPAMASALRSTNDRRNSIPDSHPFEFKTGQKTKPLKVRERDSFRLDLAGVYRDIMDFLV